MAHKLAQKESAVEEKQPPFITNYRPASDMEILHITLKPLFFFFLEHSLIWFEIVGKNAYLVFLGCCCKALIAAILNQLFVQSICPDRVMFV